MINYRVKFLGLALAGLILGACSQTGTYETADLMNEQAAVAKAGFTMTPFGTGNANAMILTGGGDYLVDCITDESGNEFSASGSLSGQWGNQNNPNEKTLEVEVWNTLTTIEYRFTLISEDMQNSGNLQYFDEVSNDWVNAGSLVFGVPFAVSRPLADGWAAGDVITEQWRNTGGGGNALEAGDVSYTLIPECTDCEESFSYVKNEDGSYTFTYKSEVDLVGAEVKFTSPHVTAVASKDDKTYTVNPGNGQGSPTVSTWTGDITACTPVTFTLLFTPDCGQNEAGFATLWTDFKVNTESKKGISETTDTIKFTCTD